VTAGNPVIRCEVYSTSMPLKSYGQSQGSASLVCGGGGRGA
jgi:hypothetical protein